MNTLNPKCSCCKCYWKPDETDIKTSGLVFKCCKKCRNYKREYFETINETISRELNSQC